MFQPLDYSSEERVVGAQALAWRVMQTKGAATSQSLSDAIIRAEAMATRLGMALPTESDFAALLPAGTPVGRTELPSFAALVAAAPLDASLADALDGDEIEAALARLHATGGLPQAETTLDRWDWAVAGTAGLLAGAADLALVGLPTNPLFRSNLDTGLLSKLVRAGFKKALSPQAVRGLEKKYKVPYDAAHNVRLGQKITGLNSNSHRFHSLGHDPCAAWVIGVADVLKGSFTAVDLDGRLIWQETSAALAGEDFFIRLITAFKRVGGHLASDVATPMGLPAPLMTLSQFFQFKAFGDDHATISAIARQMYLDGYDFRHFVAGSLAAVIVEAIIRAAWTARRIDEGASLRDALPNVAIPRLRRQLILDHATACAVNAGRIAVTHNPLTLNWAQWLALLRHVAPEIAQDLREPGRRAAAEDALLDADLRALVSPTLPKPGSASA